MRERALIALLLGSIATINACGEDGPTAPRSPAVSLTFTSEPTEALDGVPFATPVGVTALDAAGNPATVPIDVTIEAASRGYHVATT